MTAHVPTPSLKGGAHRRHLRVASAATVIPLVAFLAACGGGTGTASSSSTTPATQAPSPAPDPGTRGERAFPGAFGLIAAASPGTLQVQSATAQNTVIYTSTTTFTQVRAGHLAAGDCVTLTGTPTTGSAPGLVATSARIEAKVNGACPTPGTGSGFGGGGLPGGGGGSGQRPTGPPGGSPSAGSGARRAFAIASGTVSSVAGSAIVVKGTLRSGLGQARSATPASPTTIAVNLPASATVTQTVAATSAAAVVGRCARAIGTADTTGTITAKSITISTPGANGCNIGFGGRGQGANGAGSPGTNA